MYEDAIRFSFPNPDSAYDAFDTLQELGYAPVIDEEGAHPTLHIHVERSDVRSALEIAQMHGGQLLESAAAGEAERFEAVNPGIDIGAIDIPAHTINEDFTDDYASGLSQAYLGDEAETLTHGYMDSVYE
ncbi:DNA/RNA helicase [Paenibacillus alkalitolerans]|uniref:DNA/RNA helicase n=1 Tax=Paenibacillus alkalitolerans TaxID=2799335 RepID=UPI0018F304DC|nr:DNA/RNA helicase [Paenibacillus alkalitolerans]